jgi:AbrB family looped-hinge helix DNA binding protein
MNKTTVTSKGQVTIPKPIRERQRIAAGTRMEFAERGEELVLRKVTRATTHRGERDAEFEAYLERVGGTLDLGMTTDEYMELLRGE